MSSFETSFPKKSSLTTCQFTWSWLIPDWIRADKIGRWLFHIHEKINLKCGMQFFHLKSRFLGNEIWKFIEHTSYRAKHVETRFLQERNFKWKNYIPHVLNVWIISLFIIIFHELLISRISCTLSTERRKFLVQSCRTRCRFPAKRPRREGVQNCNLRPEQQC